MSDMILRADAIAAIQNQAGYGKDPWMQGNNSAISACAATIRALPAVEVGVKPECGHPFCGDKCGTATPAQDCREHSGDTDCSVTAYAAIARMKEAGE